MDHPISCNPIPSTAVFLQGVFYRWTFALLMGVLLLVAALVATIALWATDRAGTEPASRTQAVAAADSAVQYEWKMITTWPAATSTLAGSR